MRPWTAWHAVLAGAFTLVAIALWADGRFREALPNFNCAAFTAYIAILLHERDKRTT